MGNRYHEEQLIDRVDAGVNIGAHLTVPGGLNGINISIDILNVLLAQISESLAIIANNTRLMNEKEIVDDN